MKRERGDAFPGPGHVLGVRGAMETAMEDDRALPPQAIERVKETFGCDISELRERVGPLEDDLERVLLACFRTLPKGRRDSVLDIVGAMAATQAAPDGTAGGRDEGGEEC